MSTVRVNIRISEDIKSYFEKKSEETGASQSALMALALSEYIDQKKIINNMDLFSKLLQDKENEL